MSEKSIVIVGFQFAGAACYGQLNKLLPVNFPVKITVVSDRPYFFHNVAAPRAVSDPNWIDRSFIPIDAESALLGRANTELLIDSVVNVTKDLVHLKSGKTLPFDYLILATGSSYGAPAKSQHSTMEEAKQEFRVLAEKAKQAESVLVVGGGPVGVELAAELKSAYPNKQVTLIHSTEQILPNHGLSEKAVRKTRATLDGLGVKVLVGEKVQVDDWSTFDPLTAKTLKTDKGTELKSDLQFICIGARPNTSYLKDLGVLDDRGLVKVDSSLRVEGLNNIFAMYVLLIRCFNAKLFIKRQRGYQ